MRISLRTKTILGVAAIESLLLLLLIITAIGFLTEVIDDTLSKRAKTTASLFATATKDAVLSNDLASLESFSTELMKNPDIAYVRVLSQNGQLFASRGEQNLLGKEFIEDRQLKDVKDGVFDTAAPITEDKFVFGRIELGISIQSTQAAIARVRAWSLSLAFIELFLVAAFSYLLGSYLTRQLKVLSNGSRQVKDALKTRNFHDVKIRVQGSDELADLAKSFNNLAESLQHELQINQQQQKQLQKLNSQLEEKVMRRTEALSAKNDELLQVNKEMKETQQQLLQTEKMASVGQLAAGVAHEINNPIGYVVSNIATLKDYVSAYQLLAHQARCLANCEQSEIPESLQLLQEMLNKEDIEFINKDVEELLEESKDGLERVSEIVKGLKLFSRVDSDEKQWFDLNACLKTTLNMVNNELKYYCRVETDFKKLPQVKINVGKFNQVFTNILINAVHAIKATKRFGLITITTLVDNGQIIIKIRDSGEGIPSDTLSKIFNPFFTTKAEGSGTGLGLSISIGIVSEHGGKLIAESKIGEGSCFTIMLPTIPIEESQRHE